MIERLRGLINKCCLMAGEVPNLDAFMTDNALWSFYKESKCGRELAKFLFPHKPAGYTVATKNLGHYACNKAVAMRLRNDGKVDTAMMYDTICEHIYGRLPEWARW